MSDARGVLEVEGRASDILAGVTDALEVGGDVTEKWDCVSNTLGILMRGETAEKRNGLAKILGECVALSAGGRAGREPTGIFCKEKRTLNYYY